VLVSINCYQLCGATAAVAAVARGQALQYRGRCLYLLCIVPPGLQQDQQHASQHFTTSISKGLVTRNWCGSLSLLVVLIVQLQHWAIENTAECLVRCLDPWTLCQHKSHKLGRQPFVLQAYMWYVLTCSRPWQHRVAPNHQPCQLHLRERANDGKRQHV
jgi:hypothetical protein